MKNWAKLLPYFIVEWYAKKNLVGYTVYTKFVKKTVVTPFDGVEIEVKTEPGFYL